MVGVIVRLEKEAFKVLNQHGKLQHVPQHMVQKRNNRAVALDMNQVCVIVLYNPVVILYCLSFSEFYICQGHSESC